MCETNGESSATTQGRETRSDSRRRFLGAVGSATGLVLLAGCGGVDTETEGPTSTEPGSGTESPMGTEAADMDSETDMSTETDAGASETEETGTTADEAMLRVAHMSPNAPNVDVYIDGSAVLEDVPFGAVSEYLTVPGGSYTVMVTPAGDEETVVFEGDVTVESGTAYTVAAIGEVGEDVGQTFAPLVLTDDNEPPADDTARVRAVHVSPDGPTVDITAGETVLFDELSYGESASTEVPAGDYTVDVRGDTMSNDGTVVASFDLTLAGGQAYTAFAAGYVTPDDEPADVPFDLIVTQDTGSA